MDNKHLLALTDEEDDYQFLDDGHQRTSSSEEEGAHRLLKDARDIQRKVTEQQLQFKSEGTSSDLASQLSKTR
jgi:hypothetical protein